MDVIDAIKSRRSVRSFKKKKIPLSKVKRILELASLAPSGSNTQPWNVHVLVGDSLKSFTKEMVKEFLKNNQSLKLERLNYMEKYRTPYQERRRKVGWDLYKLLDIKKAKVRAYRKYCGGSVAERHGSSHRAAEMFGGNRRAEFGKVEQRFQPRQMRKELL